MDYGYGENAVGGCICGVEFGEERFCAYVVKNAPAETCQTKSSRVRAKNGKLKCRKVDFLHEGKVAIITLPSPWYTPRNNAGFGFPVEALV
jgi:hypothetical protein